MAISGYRVSDSHAGRLIAALALTTLAAMLGSCAAPELGGPEALRDRYKQAIASPLRTDADRKEDVRRRPLDFLEFTQVQPGMRVLDVSAGDGYTTQLIALVLGDSGVVWGQTPALRPALQERLRLHPQGNMVIVERPFEDPVPADAPPFDLITLVYNYHDIAYLPVDRARMNKRLFDALKPGGHLVLIDHSAEFGSGTRDTKTLHRIDEQLVVSELQQAGFRVEHESDTFRNPDDQRTERIFDMAIPVDNFALRFVKR